MALASIRSHSYYCQANSSYARPVSNPMVDGMVPFSPLLSKPTYLRVSTRVHEESGVKNPAQRSLLRLRRGRALASSSPTARADSRPVVSSYIIS